MNWFRNLSIRKKLTFTFSIVIGFTIVLGIFMLSALKTLHNSTAFISDDLLPSVQTVAQMQLSTARFRISEANHIANASEAEMEASEKSMRARLETLRKQQSAYENTPAPETEKKLYGEWKLLLEQYLATSQNMLQFSKDGSKSDALGIFKGQSNKLFRAMNEKIEAISEENEKAAKISGQQATEIYESARKRIIAIIIVTAITALMLTFFVARWISQQLTLALNIAEAVSAGDLTRRIQSESTDEIGKLLNTVSGMSMQLQKLVGEVRSGADHISLAASEIAQGNQDLSDRTEQQAGSLEETASAMEQLTATVRQNAASATAARTLSTQTAATAAQSGTEIAALTSTMQEISNASGKVADIVGVIDGIAFQTNILALNAAVEAARAGDQGRGFAVVASEVRTLAQRSAAAAKEIKLLIEDSVSKVNHGKHQVQCTDQRIQELVADVNKVSAMIHEITLASEEQSAGIEEVNQAIMQMDAVTQQNAALVEQAAAASKGLEEQSAHLVQLTGIFKTQQNARRHLPR